MNKNKKNFLIAVFGLSLLGILGARFIGEKDLNSNMKLKIGAGDDITGIVLQEIVEISGSENIEEVNSLENNEETIEEFTFKDC